MKKKSGSRLGRALRKRINPRAWSDFDRLKRGQAFIFDLASRLFVIQGKVNETESFEDAQSKLGLTDAQLLSRQKSLFRLTMMMLSIAAIVFIYSAYHLFKARYSSALLSLAVSLIAVSLAFRYHFWYFQIKQRKLGCSLIEWFKQGVMNAKDN